MILSTSGTVQITVSMAIPESRRSCPISSSSFSLFSPTSKANAQVLSIS